MKIKRVVIITLFILIKNTELFSQGYNHNWLIGYTSGLDTNVISKRGWLQFDSNNVTVTPDNFKMPFRAAQGNISDANGDLLMVSNGCWIADASMDTMQNGGGLNPGLFTDDWCDDISGIPFPHSNIFIPYPEDTSKYFLFHQTGSYNVPNGKSLALYYSVVNMTLNSGLGGVINGQKNLIAIQDTLNPMLAACKHANGRDWWIVAFEDNTDVLYKVLVTPSGISSVTTQHMGVSPNFYGMGQANFSPDGKKFAYHHRDFGMGGVPVYHTIRLFDFDRCSGNLTNNSIISLTDSVSGNGLAFSSNSKYLYFDTFLKLFQLNTDTTNIQASLQLIAENDTFFLHFILSKLTFG